MSSPITYPVFRTPDSALALSVARRLVAIGDRRHAEVSVDVELRTVPEVLRIREALPDAWFRKEDVDDWVRDPSDPTGLHGGVHAPDLPSDPEFLSPQLPLWASMEYRPVGSIEDGFAALVGSNIGEIWWSGLIWPDVPELDLHGEPNNARVFLLFNSRHIGVGERTDDHTVLVTVRRRGSSHDERHASWLADQIGQSVIGPGQQ
ncbi:hypothetical protein [Streptomyces sp. NRRL F-4428]|uniref:hypothetical protein n=1 Tax=Streptomyces sp. NRRL F-4428 TaxID=1609137 RepID=UPI000A644E45|nr:hypothetical protein [Streptomyces sp. NRRL F-4428]